MIDGIYRIIGMQGMTPGQRWSAARRLYWTMRRHKSAYLKSRHPDWLDDRIRLEVKKSFYMPEADLKSSESNRGTNSLSYS